ncbi:MAG: ribonuclease P protein component, partial [Lentisphaeria bacterium]
SITVSEQSVFLDLSQQQLEDGVTSLSRGKQKADRKHRRLTLHSEFRQVKKIGSKRVSRLLVVQVLKAPDGNFRQAIVISKYFSRKAVVRNRARRLLRTALTQLCPEFSCPVWIVLRPRQPLKSVKAQDVVEDLQRLCRRLNLYESADAS